MKKLQRAKDFSCNDDLLTNITNELLKYPDLHDKAMSFEKIMCFLKKMKYDLSDIEKVRLQVIDVLQQFHDVTQHYKDQKELMMQFLTLFRKQGK